MQAAPIESREPSHVVNGVDLEALGATVSTIADNPELGQSKFRARNRWANGTVNRSALDDFHAAGADHHHQRTYTLTADEPALLAGGDEAPNPVEFLLHALASCVTTSVVAHAAVKGIVIERLESELEGDIDLNGFLGLNPETPKGYSEIRMKVRARTSEESFRRLPALAEFSPVYNTLKNGANVRLEFERI
jgi:uncharacterized OsmC-like protein